MFTTGDSRVRRLATQDDDFVGLVPRLLYFHAYCEEAAVLHAMLLVPQASKNPVVKALFEGVVVEKGKLAKGQLIASQFMRSLNSLMDLICSTESHFIRCLKPNETKQPRDWNNAKVLAQVRRGFLVSPQVWGLSLDGTG